MNATDCSFTASRAVRFFVAIAAACTALCARAATYRLKPDLAGESALANEFSNPGSWQIDGVDATTYPQSGDTIEMGDYNVKNAAQQRTHVGRIAVNGDYSVAAFTKQYNKLHLYASGDAQSSASLTITGTIGGSSYQYYYIYEGASLVASAGSQMYGARWDDSPSYFTIESGGAAEIYGSLDSRHLVWTIKNGASLTFDPSSYSNFTSSEIIKNAGDVFNVLGGSLIFPHGLAVTGGNSAYDNIISNNSGTITFGGNFTSAVTDWDFVWSAGTLNITDNCAFGNNISLVLPANSSVTLDVASGKTFSAPNVTTEYPVTITKTGGGTFAMPQTAATVSVTAGGLGLGAGTYELSNVSFASQTKIVLSTLGATITGFQSASIANVTFEADLSGVTAGSVVISSSNADLLAKAKADLDASVPAGFDLVISGGTLAVEAETAGKFTITGDILGTTGWGGTIPDAGSDVSIDGTDVIATYSGGTLPAWNSIEVKNGATLRVAANLTLPKIILNKNATLAIGNNAVVTLANIADLAGTIATTPDVVVPVLSVESGATLNVPGGMKFSNVNVSLAGTLATTTSGGVTFGYANGGESTYIGFTASNGSELKIFEGTSSSYGLDPLEFCCPAAGGSVIPSGTMTLTNVSLTKNSGYDYSTGHCHGFHLGVNNPANIPFEVVFDNTTWGVGGKVKIQGGAKFSLRNNGAFVNYEHHTAWDRHFDISENGQIVVGNGCELRVNALGNYGGNPATVNPTTDGYTAITVEEGGVFEVYTTEGNGNGVVSIAGDARWTVFEPYIVNNDEVKSTCIPFYGLDSVDVALNATLTFTTRNRKFSWTPTVVDDLGADRVVSLANVPITGGGSIALSNDNVNVFGVIVTCGENTATGTAKVIPPASGKGETALYFANGANWAGTVVAGNVALTNLVDAAATCTNTFGTLDLAAGTELKLRVWKTNGAITAHDGLNVGEYVNNGGRITLEQMDEEFAAADKFILGTIGADSPLPVMSKPWRVVRDGEGRLVAKASSGLSIVIR